MDSFRPKIWCSFLNKGTISNLQGDSVGEIRLIRMLCAFADVYYNGKLVKPEDSTFGQGEELVFPSNIYDLYYVRANNELFLKLPHPKVCMAYPYDETVFKEADALVVTTDIWKKIITNPKIRSEYQHFFDKWYPNNAHFPNKVIQFKQSGDPNFNSRTLDQKKIDAWRYKLTNINTFGFYGRLDICSLPYSALNALDNFSADMSPLVVFAGKIREKLRQKEDILKGHLYLGSVDYEDMPYLICATSCTLAGESSDDQVLGSNKIQDSISLGVPVICKKNPVRDEYLGADYPGIFTDVASAAEIIGRFMLDEGFREELLSATKKAALKNSVPSASIFTRNEVLLLLKEVVKN